MDLSIKNFPEQLNHALKLEALKKKVYLRDLIVSLLAEAVDTPAPTVERRKRGRPFVKQTS